MRIALIALLVATPVLAEEPLYKKAIRCSAEKLTVFALTTDDKPEDVAQKAILACFAEWATAVRSTPQPRMVDLFKDRAIDHFMAFGKAEVERLRQGGVPLPPPPAPEPDRAA